MLYHAIAHNAAITILHCLCNDKPPTTPPHTDHQNHATAAIALHTIVKKRHVSFLKAYFQMSYRGRSEKFEFFSSICSFPQRSEAEIISL